MDNLCFQYVVVTPRAQAACNVLIHPANAHVKLVIMASHVTLLVDAILQAQVAQLVMFRLVSVLVILVTQELRVIPVLRIITEKVMEHVQVRVMSL